MSMYNEQTLQEAKLWDRKVTGHDCLLVSMPHPKTPERSARNYKSKVERERSDFQVMSTTTVVGISSRPAENLEKIPEENLVVNTCMPSTPLIPTPISASCIMPTSLAPSPIPRVVLPVPSLTSFVICKNKPPKEGVFVQSAIKFI